MSRRGWRPGGRWEPIVGGLGQDRGLVYWRMRLPDGTILTVKGLRWAHRGRSSGPGSSYLILAEGEAKSSSAAKQAAEDHIAKAPA